MKKIKEKLNDMKENIVYSDEQSEMKRFGITVLSLTVIVLAVFMFTKYVVNDGDVNIVVFDSYAGAINYNVITVGTILGKSDEEYYVLAYSSEDLNVASYQGVAYAYTSQESEDLIPVYSLDLETAFNIDYKATDENPENTEATSIDELSFGDITLIKVKNGKIVKYLNDLDDIREELAVTE